jgi:hypothetical protein
VFDIRRSEQAAETWRKYVIEYTEPGVPIPIRTSVPMLEGRKQDDYQSLLARFQILELEVKLLKEAFKMHTTSARLPRTTQPSVFAKACGNSDLSPHPPVYAEALLPVSREQYQPPNHGPQLSTNLDSSRWHETRLPMFWPKTKEPTSNEGPSRGSIRPPEFSARALAPEEYPDPIRFVSTPANGPRVATEEAKPANQNNAGGFSHQCHAQTHSMAREACKKAEASIEDANRILNGLGKPEAVNNRVNTAQCMVLEPTKAISAKASLQQPFERAETSHRSIPPPLSKPNSSKSLLDLEPEAEIARFPTIFQLEKEGLPSVKGESSTAQDPGRSTSYLTRANTVTSSNPAARLLRPFDPAAEGFAEPAASPLPRRRGTERHRRRPYAEQFTGSGRTLWEEFERAGPQRSENSNVMQQMFRKPEPRPYEVVTSTDTRSGPQAIDAYRHISANPPQTHHRLHPMRSAVDLSSSQRARGRSNQEPLYSATNNASTPNLLSRRATTATANDAPDRFRNRLVEKCAKSLEDMGYTPLDRLPIYAEACDGNLSKAMTMAEEDGRAMAEMRSKAEMKEKVYHCVQRLKEMGYGRGFGKERLEKFAKEAGGDVGAAVEKMERAMGEEEDRRVVRRLIGLEGGMPGSFP